MTKNKLNLAFLALAALASAEDSYATPVTYAFTAINFTSFYQTAIPVTSVSGTYTLDNGGLVGINLTIGSHIYSLNEVEWTPLQNPYAPPEYMLGGINNGAGIMSAGTNDFILGVSTGGQDPSFASFQYTVPGINNDSFFTSTGTLTAVPLPGSIVLLSSALFGVLSFRGKKD